MTDLTEARLTEAAGMRGLEAGANRVTEDHGVEPPAFLPTDLADLAVWFDASVAGDLLLSGSYVYQWNDRSGNGRNLTAASGGDLPQRTGTQNGLATVEWAASAALGTSGYNPPAQPLTFFVVTKVTTNTWGGIIGGGGGVQGIRRAGSNYIAFDWGTGQYYGPDVPDNANHHVIVGVANGASSKQRIDGVELGTANTGTGDPSLFAIGRDNDNNPLTGAIAECGMYTRALTPTELTDLEAYLTAKWDL